MNIIVVGLGSVGLPMAVWLANKGYQVIGIDVSKQRVEAINAGCSDLQEAVPTGEDFRSILKRCIENGTLTATCEYCRAKEGKHVFLFTVGVPVRPDGSCDQRPLSFAIDSLSKIIVRGDLVIIKSTLIPGTMRETILPQLKQCGLAPGADFALAYCPERLAEGSAIIDFDRVSRLVSAEDARSLAEALEFWRTISSAECIPVQSFLVAELSKVVENMHRDANIAFSNELFPLLNSLDVPFSDLQTAANTHPRVELLDPGPGVGGHCLPNAIAYLYPLAARFGVPINLAALARSVNLDRPKQVAQSVSGLCRRFRGEITSIVILGIGMKDYCSDTRNSPAVALEKELSALGIKVRTFDPVIQNQGEKLSPVLAGATAVIITAFQHGMGYQEIIAAISAQEKPPLLFDTRGRVPKLEAAKAGVEVYYV